MSPKSHMPTRMVSTDVLALCRQLVPNGQLLVVPLKPVPGAAADDCFPAVARHVISAGGTVCYGWKLCVLPGILVEALFHAVWQNPAGQLLDITPDPEGINRILFVPDPGKTYEGHRVKSVQRALSTHPAVKDYLRACDDHFEFLNRGARANQYGPLGLSQSEADELMDIEVRKARALDAIRESLPKPGRNDPCPCGSGKKLKKCHGVGNTETGFRPRI